MPSPRPVPGSLDLDACLPENPTLRAEAVPAPRTEPGSLDLDDRLPEHPVFRAEAIAARAACDPLGHPAGTYNPWHGTYCRCGLVIYPGNVAPRPERRVIVPRGKYSESLIPSPRAALAADEVPDAEPLPTVEDVRGALGEELAGALAGIPVAPAVAEALDALAVAATSGDRQARQHAGERLVVAVAQLIAAADVEAGHEARPCSACGRDDSECVAGMRELGLACCGACASHVTHESV